MRLAFRYLFLMCICTSPYWSDVAHAQDQTLTLPFTTGRSITSGWIRTDTNVLHGAIDYNAPLGTVVLAADAGWAIASCELPGPGFGNFVLVQHANGYSSLYAHLSKILLNADAILPCGGRHSIVGIGTIQYGGDVYTRQWVERGTVIGESGMTGADQEHLHVQVSRNPDASYTSAWTHTNRRDPYAIEEIARFYPPTGSCENRKPSLIYFWTLCPPVPSSPPVPSAGLSDSFNDNSINTSLWDVAIVPGGSGTITETNQRIEMVKLVAGSQYLGLQSKCVVRGDFDVQVDFALSNWPVGNFHTVRLSADGLPPGPFGVVGIYRNSYNDENYQFRAAGGVVASVTGAGVLGKLRLKRSGSTIDGYYWDGTSFVLIGSSPTSTDDTRFVIDFAGADGSSITPPAGVVIAFDEFKVNVGTAVCPSGSAIFSNFGPTDDIGGQASWGIGLHPTEEPYHRAMSFVPVGNYRLDSMVLGLSDSGPVFYQPPLLPVQLDVAVTADESGVPGSILETYHLSSVPIYPSIGVTINSSTHPLLLANVRYWITVTATFPTQTSASWYLNLLGQQGLVAWHAGSGTPWVAWMATEGAFTVNGSLVP